MSNIVPDGFGSTYLSPRIETYEDLVYRTKSLLGWPSVPVEITDTQWAHIIDKAVEDFTAFEGNREEEYLVFCSNVYYRSCGVKLDELLNAGCNSQHCYETLVTETVTSTYFSCDTIETATAYLSVTPFQYATQYNYLNPNSIAYSGTSGQNHYLYFDPSNPWNAMDVCQANCITINPVSSQYYQLSTNPNLSSFVFDFTNDAILADVLTAVYDYIPEEYGFDYVPMSGIGNAVSSIPISFFPLSAFYPEDILFGPPVEACINIGQGTGFVYPNCDTSLITACAPLTSQYGISPSVNYVLTSTMISSVYVDTSATTFADISAYFAEYCNDCNCNCQFISSLNTETSAYYFEVNTPVISADSGVTWEISARDISDATHIRFYGVPSCTTDGSIPLDSNDGILGTFTLCNTAFSTNGPMHLDKVQFFKDNKPPLEILYEQNCNWTNNGFTFSYYNSAYSECVRATPEKVKVDVTFSNCSMITEIGTTSSYLSSNVDGSLNRKRKILGVFSTDTASQGGFFGGGSDLLFNFDYALLANTFGYDLMGSRNNMGKQGYDLLTYHMARDFVDHSKKMLRYVTYQFNPQTQYLKLIPEPPGALYNPSASCCNLSTMRSGLQCYIVGVYMEPKIETIVSNYFIKEYVLALAMITLGRIRSTYGGVTLFGGATLAGDALITKGEERVKELMAELRDEYRYSSPAGFYCG